MSFGKNRRKMTCGIGLACTEYQCCRKKSLRKSMRPPGSPIPQLIVCQYLTTLPQAIRSEYGKSARTRGCVVDACAFVIFSRDTVGGILSENQGCQGVATFFP